MNLTTRERLLQAATRLFADEGYRGASVRDICNQAGANPGAVSYHFGGKRQLYRAVLRRAASELAALAPPDDGDDPPAEGMNAVVALRRLLRRLTGDDAAVRLLLRDLADGGAVAVEALTPPLRSAFERLATLLGEGDTPRGSARGRALFLGLAAPVLLLGAAWPVVARALDLQSEQREALLDELVRGALRAHGGAESIER
jgi:AcrR family transcriptional regulator